MPKERKSCGKLGRLRVDDDSLTELGINKGEVAIVELGKDPADGELCAAFTAYGKLVIRNYHREENGDIRLDKGADSKLIQVFAPKAVMIFGPVVGVEKGGA